MDKSLDNINNQLLLISSANGETENLQKYMKEGAYIDVKDANGYTPLMCAAYNKHLEAVKILVEAGANVNLKDTGTYGFTVLQFAASFGLLEMAKIILKTKQTNIHEIKSSGGKTAMDLASTTELQELLVNDLINRTERKMTQKRVVKKVEEKKVEGNLLPKLANIQPPVVEGEVLTQNDTATRSQKRKKMVRMLGVGGFLFVIFLHFWFTPYGFPLFLAPCGLILFAVALCQIKKRKEELWEKDIYQISIHALCYITMNSIFVWWNLWGGGFPWSIFTVVIGGLFLAMHTLKIKYKDSRYNNKFVIHAMFFSVFAFLVFTMFIFGTCGNSYHRERYMKRVAHNQHAKNKNRPHHKWRQWRQWKHSHNHKHRHPFCRRSIIGFAFFMMPVFIWGLILAIHYSKWRKNSQAVGCCGMKVSFNQEQ